MEKKQLTEQEKVQEIAKKSFMLGVNWLLKVMVDAEKSDPGIWESFTEETATLLRSRANKVMEQ